MMQWLETSLLPCKGRGSLRWLAFVHRSWMSLTFCLVLDSEMFYVPSTCRCLWIASKWLSSSVTIRPVLCRCCCRSNASPSMRGRAWHGRSHPRLLPSSSLHVRLFFGWIRGVASSSFFPWMVVREGKGGFPLVLVSNDRWDGNDWSSVDCIRRRRRWRRTTTRPCNRGGPLDWWCRPCSCVGRSSSDPKREKKTREGGETKRSTRNPPSPSEPPGRWTKSTSCTPPTSDEPCRWSDEG